MNSREYEQHQLALIAQSYRQQGFQVEHEGRIEGVPEWRFDAVARSKTGETVIIELVNSRASYADAQNRLKALEAVAATQLDVKVDFRYLDVDIGTAWVTQNLRQADTASNLRQALEARPPRLPNDTAQVTAKFVTLWLRHVSLIRAYCMRLGLAEVRGEGALDLYNELLRTQNLVAPEAMQTDVTQDLFELYAAAQGALQGGTISLEEFQQLRMHFINLRQQIRKRLVETVRQ